MEQSLGQQVLKNGNPMKNKIEVLTITIFKAESEDGYFYDIYDCEVGDANDGRDALDGGLCTTTIKNAIEMACDQAKALIK